MRRIIFWLVIATLIFATTPDTFAQDDPVNTYLKLPFGSQKRVDRITAIRHVNKQYLLNPQLILEDREKYWALPQEERQHIQQLGQILRSGKEGVQSILKSESYQFYQNIGEDLLPMYNRMIVRFTMGLDDDGLVRMYDSDWRFYKTLSNEQVDDLKTMAQTIAQEQDLFVYSQKAVNATPVAKTNDQPEAKPANPKEVVTKKQTQNSDERPSPTGSSPQFESIFFNSNSASLRPEAKNALQDLKTLQQRESNLQITVVGYANQATEKTDNSLAQKRAKIVYDHLNNIGISDDQLTLGTPQVVQGTDDPMKNPLYRRVDLQLSGIGNYYQPAYRNHVIEPGMTLYSLSRQFNMTVDQLKAINGLQSNTIYAYDPIRVKNVINTEGQPPLAQEVVTPSASMKQEETTETPKGQAPVATEKAENQAPEEAPVAEEEIQEEPAPVAEETEEQPEEPAAKPAEIDEGQYRVLKVREIKEEEKPDGIHVVKEGEDLKDIAKQYGLKRRDLIKLNGLKNRRDIEVGQELRVK